MASSFFTLIGSNLYSGSIKLPNLLYIPGNGESTILIIWISNRNCVKVSFKY